jgi:ABC-type sugar transport system substrate-binding protein
LKKTSICFLSAFILISGLWTFVLPQEKLRIAVVPKTKIGVFWNSVLTGAKLESVALGNVEIVGEFLQNMLHGHRFLPLSSVLQKVYPE